MASIGIRREEKNRWERRAPLTPLHVEELVREQGIGVVVEPSPIRVYPEEAYRRAGARISADLSRCRLILGIKEIPAEALLPAKPQLCFWHVIKGQPKNMPLLRRALDLGCTLIDYEPIVDRHGRRLIFFGRHAGYAGTLDALWALGRRLAAEGLDAPFAALGPAHAYRSLDEATGFLADVVGRRIREQGLPAVLHPLVVGITGGGNVAQGAGEILDRLPVVEVEPEALAGLAGDPTLSHRALYKVVFRREQRRRFARHLPHLTVLVNGIYWEPGDPRLVGRDDLRGLWAGEAAPRLRVLADLSCDVDGSIEATVRAGDPGDPVYVYGPETGRATSGVQGRGPVVLAVENLPAELPRDASEHFGDSLFPFLAGLAGADYGVDFEHLSLPAAVLAAVVAHRGELTPGFRYLEEDLKQAGV